MKNSRCVLAIARRSLPCASTMTGGETYTVLCLECLRLIDSQEKRCKRCSRYICPDCGNLKSLEAKRCYRCSQDHVYQLRHGNDPHPQHNCVNCGRPTRADSGYCGRCQNRKCKPCPDCGVLIFPASFFCNRCFQCGERSGLWKGGISFEPYGREFNENLKSQIRDRDGYLCQFPGCYLPEITKHHTVHHIDYNKKHNHQKNLITLCAKHHSKSSKGDREHWTELFQELQILRGLV